MINKIKKIVLSTYTAQFLLAVTFFILPTLILAQGVGPQGNISSSPSSCPTSSCTISISWNVTQNPDGESSADVRVDGGPSFNGVSLSGSQSGVNITAPTSIKLYVGGALAGQTSVNIVAPTNTPTPTPTAVPSVPDYRSCNQPCGSSNSQCISGLSCQNGLCRLPSNPNDSNCTPPSANTTGSSNTSNSSPTATPTLKPASTNTRANTSGGSVNIPEGDILGSSTTNQPEVLGTDTEAESASSELYLKPTPTPASIWTQITSSPTKIILAIVNGSLGVLAVLLILQLLGVVKIGFISSILNRLSAKK